MTLDEKKRAVALAPGDVGARVALARALMDDGDLSGAERQLDAARARAPDDHAARRLELALLTRQGRHAQAEVAALGWLDARGDDADALLDAADVFSAMGRELEATIFAERASELAALSAARRAQLGVSLHRLGHPARALAHLARAHRDGAPGLDEVLAAVRLELGDVAAPARSRDALVGRMRDTYRGAQLGPAFADVARALDAGDVASVKRALALLEPGARSSAWFDLVRGDALLCEASRPAARAAFERAARRDPANDVAHARAAEAALEDGDAARAREVLRSAVNVDASATLQEALGDACRALGDDAAAVAAYERARALSPGSRAVLELARLREREQLAPTGRVHVLGWTPLGGCASPVEAVAVPGSGQLRITGNVARDGREAAEVAYTCLKARAAALGIADRVLARDLHLRYDDAHVQKTGASSGLALALAGWSAIAEVPLPRGLATTGELTLQGGVRPIDGLRDKLAAARLGAHPLVLFPRRNLLAWDKVPRAIRDRVNARPVDTLAEALRVLREHDA